MRPRRVIANVNAVAVVESLMRIAASPPGWSQALAEFAQAPTWEGWSEPMRFVPPEYAYQRMRDTVRRLRKLGVDGDRLFQYASP